MTRWRPYPECKDSGLPWLVEVPTHWDIRKLKHISSVTLSNVDKQKNEGERSIHLCNYVDVYYNDYITADLEFMEATASPEEVRKFALKEGDVIITKDSESWDDIAVAAHVPSDLEGVLCGYHLALVRPNQQVIDGKYLFQSFCTSQINERFTVEATGITRYGLAKHWIDNASFLVPPLPEQHAIATFLDHQTTKIDALIAEQHRLIELLQERRAALISHAVSRELDPEASMKDSGTNLHPSVPEHWSVTRLRYLCRDVADGPHFSPSYVDDGIMFLSARNVKVDRWSLHDAKYISEEDYQEFCKRVIPEGGDVLYTKGGTTGIARVVDLEELFHVWVHIAVLKLHRDEVDPYFLAYTLNGVACYGQAQLYTRGATNNDLGLTRLVNIVLGLPPLREQRTIAAFLDRETAKIDALIAESETGVAHLEEYRTALISAAVTGKIDVRDALPAGAPAQPRLTGP